MDGFSLGVILVLMFLLLRATVQRDSFRAKNERMRDDILDIYHDMPVPTSNWEDIEVDRQNRAHKKMAKWLGEK